jgi:ParB family chromosome partitioning protein
VAETVQVTTRPVSSLKPWQYAVELFGNLAEEEFRELVRSVSEHGVLVPLVVRPDGTILCGHQRVRAARQAGLQEVPCIEVDPPSEEACKLIAIDDNLKRRHLSPIDRAKLFVERKKVAEATRRKDGSEPGLSRDLAASGLGISGRQAQKYEAIHRLPAEVKEMVSRGELGVEAAAQVARVSSGEEAVQLAREVVQSRVPAKEVRKVAERVLGRPSGEPVQAAGPEQKVMLGDLMLGLGKIVQISRTDPFALASACTTDELKQICELAEVAEGWVRNLRRAASRELARRTARAG